MRQPTAVSGAQQGRVLRRLNGGDAEPVLGRAGGKIRSPNGAPPQYPCGPNTVMPKRFSSARPKRYFISGPS